jgi:hypothetical protein
MPRRVIVEEDGTKKAVGEFPIYWKDLTQEAQNRIIEDGFDLDEEYYDRFPMMNFVQESFYWED